MIKQAITKYGIAEGIAVNDECMLFRGIPYTAPPVGELRFRPPKPPHPWNGIRKCDVWSAVCPQDTNHTPDSPYGIEFYSENYPPHMDEDCLFLNIWTPAKDKEDRLPVMMWLHGGGVQNGYGHEMEFDGEALARRGVILITVNYRLNLFGFFAHELLTEESGHNASGNYGIMDQIQALRWIRENISAFGGNPDNITVFGQSGGGRSTQALCCSPLSKGLLQHAAIHSAGGVLTGLGRIGRRLLEERGAKFFSMFDLRTLAQIRALPWERLLEMFLEYTRETGSIFNGFNICSDGWVLPESMEDTVIQGHHHDIDYLIGCTISEAEHNFGASDFNMCASLRAMAHCQIKQGRKPMYLYVFERHLPGIRENAFIDEAFHSAELWYLFGTLKRCWRPFTPGDYKLSEEMMDYWTNFAKTGNPNGDGLTEWLPYTRPAFLELALSTNGCKMKDYSMDGRMEQLENELLNRK